MGLKTMIDHTQVEFGLLVMGKIWLFFLKVVFAVVGGIIALNLSGDIDLDGRVKVTRGLVLRVSLGVTLSLTGGSLAVEVWGRSLTPLAEGFVFLTLGVFGMLLIGVLYQSIELMRGKTVTQIIGEVGDSLRKIKGR